MQKNDFRTKKHLGQNFLKDEFYLNRIIESIPKKAWDYKIVEIGIGLGDLTKKLINEVQKTCVLAYEIDDELIKNAKKIFKKELDSKLLILEHKDVLELKFLSEDEYFLVSNLPYYIATKIILNAIQDGRCKGFVVMIQKEVAIKFCAKTSQKEFCALSVIAQSLGDVKLNFMVPSHAFSPPPNVISAVFSFVKKEFRKEFLSDALSEILRASFSSPRKKLKTNLKNLFNDIRLQEIFTTLQLKENIRPHELDCKKYIEISKYLKKNYKE